MTRAKTERDLIVERIKRVIKPVSLIERAADVVQMHLDKERRAFGNCRLCYGKGYATTMRYATAHADFLGDDTVTQMLSLVSYCRCDRGRQLKELAAAGAFKTSPKKKKA